MTPAWPDGSESLEDCLAPHHWQSWHQASAEMGSGGGRPWHMQGENRKLIYSPIGDTSIQGGDVPVAERTISASSLQLLGKH